VERCSKRKEILSTSTVLGRQISCLGGGGGGGGQRCCAGGGLRGGGGGGRGDGGDEKRGGRVEPMGRIVVGGVMGGGSWGLCRWGEKEQGPQLHDGNADKLENDHLGEEEQRGNETLNGTGTTKWACRVYAGNRRQERPALGIRGLGRSPQKGKSTKQIKEPENK